nr:hypothetical protein [Candidatus Freyrarchaeum guaymaensis]
MRSCTSRVSPVRGAGEHYDPEEELVKLALGIPFKCAVCGGVHEIGKVYTWGRCYRAAKKVIIRAINNYRRARITFRDRVLKGSRAIYKVESSYRHHFQIDLSPPMVLTNYERLRLEALKVAEARDAIERMIERRVAELPTGRVVYLLNVADGVVRKVVVDYGDESALLDGESVVEAAFPVKGVKWFQTVKGKGWVREVESDLCWITEDLKYAIVRRRTSLYKVEVKPLYKRRVDVEDEYYFASMDGACMKLNSTVVKRYSPRKTLKKVLEMIGEKYVLQGGHRPLRRAGSGRLRP